MIMSAIDASQRRSEQEITFSICTLVTRWDEYAIMEKSFRDGGFTDDGCEYLYLDNSNGNNFDGFSGLNLFLGNALGRYIILCHQDVRLIDDDRTKLESIIEHMVQTHPAWGILGNAGATAGGELRLCISDPHGAENYQGNFPAEVISLDENFLVVRREANLALSADIGGFHMYGTDLCLVASLLGWTCYVIDFHLLHISPGVIGNQLWQARQKIIEKYKKFMRPRLVTTTCTVFLIGGGFLARWWHSKICRKFVRSIRKRFLS